MLRIANANEAWGSHGLCHCQESSKPTQTWQVQAVAGQTCLGGVCGEGGKMWKEMPITWLHRHFTIDDRLKSWPSRQTTKRRRRRRRKRRHAHGAGQRLSVVANTKFGILMRWALFLEPLRSRSCFHFADLCGHCRLRHRIVIVFGIFMANRRTNFYVLFTKSLFLSLCVSINVRLSLRCCHVEIFPGQTLPANRASNEEVQFRLVIDRYPVAVWVCGIYRHWLPISI